MQNVDFKKRAEYYESLREYEHHHNLKPTIELYMKEYKDLSNKLGDYKKQ